MNRKLRFTLFFILLAFVNTGFAFCERPDQANNPFCQNQKQFDADNQEKQDVIQLSVALDDQVYTDKFGTTAITGNVLLNDWACNKKPCTKKVSAAGISTATLDSSVRGRYGVLSLDSSGAYTYSLDIEKVKALKAGEEVTDIFHYTMREPWYGYLYAAKLVIHVLGSDAALPPALQAIQDSIVAMPDAGFVTKNGQLTFTGNAAANDTGMISTVLLSPPTSPYGNLDFDSSGNFTYNLFNDLPEVQSLAPGENIIDQFTYMIIGQFGFTSTSTITITIQGNLADLTPEEQAIKDNVFALPDEATVIKNNSLTVSGKLTSNDSGFLTAFLNGDPAGQGHYGHLQLDSDGNFVYTLFNDLSAVQDLQEGQFLVDIFSYGIEGLHGYRSTSTLTIYILGNRTTLTPEEQLIRDSIVAFDDQDTVIKDILFVANGNVLNNDTGAITVKLISDPNTAYGSLRFDSDGNYEYVLDNNAQAVKDIPDTGYAVDRFSYEITGQKGYTDTAELAITILGKDAANNAQPSLSIVALNDTNTIVRGTQPSASGNVGDNDSGAVNFILTSSPSALYGSLSLDSLGNYTYNLFTDTTALDSACAADPTGFVTDVFKYKIQGTNGLVNPGFDTAKLTIYILCDANSNVADIQAILNGIVANPDEFTLVKNVAGPDAGATGPQVSGNVISNDTNVTSAALIGPAVGTYGVLQFDSSGQFTYTLLNDLPAVQALGPNDLVEEVFSYQAIGGLGLFKEGILKIRILGSPAALVDNIEIEINDTSKQANTLIDGQVMKGHLQTVNDRDWFVITAAPAPGGGESKLRFELCPQNSSCFNEGSWVLYVFDMAKEKLPVGFESKTVPLYRRRDDNGAIIATLAVVDHMYLMYRLGFYDPDPVQPQKKAHLIGVIDPCFGDQRTLDVGVSAPTTFYVAISSPLMGSDSKTQCGQGSVILTQPGPDFIVDPTTTPPTTTTTTDDYIAPFPFREDQYVFSVFSSSIVTRVTALDTPVNTYDASRSKAEISTIRVGDTLYKATLQLVPGSGALGAVKLELADLEALPGGLRGSPLQAAYNPETNQVHIPRVQDIHSGRFYDVWLLYYPPKGGQAQYLEVLDIKPVH